ncbi:hypothetical protein BD311DRAFT_755981 [Dichomitus squalens]|uniref:Uncharacterized protein n=1 Tax=Dichomitus squalens TaxID=114155 RepID=A0A4Q9MQ54_9APHY|nr:hypothetical protein BD311DRAFT_755981 [Dichomitus squalens]
MNTRGMDYETTKEVPRRRRPICVRQKARRSKRSHISTHRTTMGQKNQKRAVYLTA